MKQDSRNLYLAIGLSLLVLIGWNYFFAGPQVEKARQAQIVREQQAQTQTTSDTTARSDLNVPGQRSLPGESPQTQLSRPEALAASPRVKLDTPNLFGSINLRGARIDDVSLKAYRETVAKDSPNIVLLSPSGTPAPYYADAGFVAPAEAGLLLPKSDTLWSADREVLTPEAPVTLTYDNGQGLIFHRTISVDDRFMFTLTDKVENKTDKPVTLYPYSLVSRHGRPVTAGYAVLHEGMVGVIGDNGLQEITYDKIHKEENATKSFKGTGGWLGFTDKYWAAVIAPDQATPFEGRFSERGTTTPLYQTDALGPALTIAPGGTGGDMSRLFAGAKETQTLDDYRNELGIKKFDLLIDWGYFYFITRPMFWILHTIYQVVGNFGVAILCITVLVKAVFFPLANRSYLSMAKMKAIQPQMLALRERYADDKVKQQQELMELYKREKINPVAGCLPMLIQIPVFFALYKVLFVTIEMRQAPFFGWIRDLSAPDPTNIFNLFGLLPFDPTHLPMIGHFLAIGIWPLIMGVSMFFQMKMNPEPADPVQKQMFSWMPVIFTFMLGTFPSGLVIYWTWNNTLSVLQQSLIMKRAGVKVELWDNLMSTFRKKAVT
ncbi:membrane protein insertase YidC [Beijerinckia indica]|uniref:Membrane protein insertase YidC n=1 Tax=Beijerinckia indica subsp. indica (strain ATCC 9039 / DSM 1715 / NCIMB 8712) TaxID=395963 RepID=YIDC_BEII9|nr:membrane protein insertase YidC [Beijerinckia indica]B2IDV5.1 RecName: Full=Membrane protein insertase YidC; AltName: Full=Foldase YidC; AltName: Full=Membrane integrase YidC; AltName: Full=Membrane protein YidC [Beijerinckia indica subsp. indica ATCC 9039]ACB96887.1 60 kDa inner membrane insertion protein [Beijerinckia indica subsp. indica ATCC 9039]